MSSAPLLPIRLTSKIVPGFGRGSKELGIPTANISRDDLHCEIEFDKLPTGIYWGFARVMGQSTATSGTKTITKEFSDTTSAVGKCKSACPPGTVYKAAISIGFNPYYSNEQKTVEPHLIAPPDDPNRHVSSCGETQFDDMYGLNIRLSIAGYIRPELPFEGLEKLKEAIKNDILETERLCGNETNMIVASESSWVRASDSGM